MNAERFVDCLKNPSQLYQVRYQELKSLVLQYPYCQNLRYLLVQKSKMDKHKDFDRNLALAATYSIDRGFLFKELEVEKQEADNISSVHLGPDYLELDDLSQSILSSASDSEPDNDDGFIEIPPAPESDFEFQIGESVSDEEQKVNLELETLEILDENVPKNFEPSKRFDQNKESEDIDLEKPISEALNELFEDNFAKPKLSTPKNDEIEELFKLEDETDQEPADIISNQNKKTFWSELEAVFPEGELFTDLRFDQLGGFAAEIVGITKKHLKKVSHISNDLSKKSRIKTTAKVNSENKMNQAPKPVPKSSFSSWLKQFSPPVVKVSIEATEEDKTSKDASGKDREPLPKKSVSIIAEQSVLESDDLVSETLAELLVKQRSFKKAIAMYEKLRLLFPNKSSFFAKRIEELKSNLI